MEKKVLVACGGTGAHVTLAYLRLHILGYALGFFTPKTNPDDRSLPSLFLVDQDDGSAEDKATAWQAACELLRQHPANFGLDHGIKIGGNIQPISVTPLPVGSDKKWFDKPNDNLEARYDKSELTRLFFDRRQREVNYSLGMMGAPALGSLLFELKRSDKNDKGSLHDTEYSNLVYACGRNSRVVITGSGVGGTGASIAPTFALQCHDNQADVMAVMIQRWFKFATDETNHEIRDKARDRNKLMEQNEVTGLASYGEQLVRKIPTVIAGVRDTHAKIRQYTADNQQPKSESYLHAVAALSCFRHYTDGPIQRGLYCMAAENPSKLTWGLRLPGGTLGELVLRATVLEKILRSIVQILRADHRYKWWGLVSEIHRFAERATNDPANTANALEGLANTYSEQLEWVKDLGGRSPVAEDGQIRKKYLQINKIQASFRNSDCANYSGLSPRQAAQALFEWAASWVREDPLHMDAQTENAEGGRFYWPQKDGQGLSFPSAEPGLLAELPIEKAKPAIDSLIAGRSDLVRQNGWPKPFAAVQHYRYLIEQKEQSAVRKLEMMIFGLITGDLILKQTSDADDYQTPSLTGLLSSFRKQQCPDVAKHLVISRKTNSVIGFNSPDTLFCPCPDSDDTVWEQIWQTLTDSPFPEGWQKAEVNWGARIDRVRGSVQRWLNQLRVQNPTESPPWVKALEDGSLQERPVWPGELLKVFWGGDSIEDCVTVLFPEPSYQPNVAAVSRYWADLLNNGTELDEEAFRKEVPEFFGGLTIDGQDFKTGEIVVPDSSREQFIWYEHLSQLQAQHKITYWLFDYRERELILELDSKRFVRLKKFREIRKQDIKVKTCVPLDQSNIPGDESDSEIPMYPDLPLKAEFIGLLQTKEGECVVEEYLMKGRPVPSAAHECEVRGNGTVSWKLHLKGRSDPFTINVYATDSAGAHWMVWPRFMSSVREDPWSAYYLYQYSTEAKLRVEALVLDGTGIKTRKSRKLREVHAINYDIKRRLHDGGAPIALAAQLKGEEAGIYLTHLEPVSQRGARWQMAVDFGTSHSVAAVNLPSGEKARIVELRAELGQDRRTGNALSKHISQYWGKVDLPNIDVWLPTYWNSERHQATSGDLQGLLPTELFSKVALRHLDSTALQNWIPGEDFGIPVLRLRRPDLAEHILSGFKWDVDQRKFSADVRLLREFYLSMLLEIVVAETVMSAGGIPARIEFTFTYPLRSSHSEVAKFKELLESKVLSSAGQTFGTELTMVNGEGLYNESEAARGGTGKFAEIVLVGDLGGGTLDLFISAHDGSDIKFRKLANSVQIGGSLFLRHLANNHELFLPRNGGWSKRPEECLSQLNAWMRSQGAVNLFGSRAHGSQDDQLGLRGFESSAAGNSVRQAIDWYFGLLVEYMARSLVGFVIREWDRRRTGLDGQTRQDFPKLSVKVQLRGNGWKLWYGNTEYSEIEELVKDWLCWSAKNALWSFRSEQQIPENSCWDVPHGKNMRPKHDPTVRAVGQSLPHEKALKNGFTLPLSNLDQLDLETWQRETLPWLEEFPMEFKSIEMEFVEVEPSMIIGLPTGKQFEVDRLDDTATREINDEIKSSRIESEGKIDAPVAALIWEYCFNSVMRSMEWGTPVKRNRK